MPAVRSTLLALLILVLALAVGAGVLAYSVARRGLDARGQPSRVEEVAARAMRRLATPAATRLRTNPVETTPEVLEEGLQHFADHCAICHANDGSGDTEIGRNLYPKAPDMRASATQGLTDGELFSIIENGVRLTGMPAWGTGSEESERASWALVHFIRRLPTLSQEELVRMEALNPKPAAEYRREEEIRRFLDGGDPPSTSSSGAGHHD
jgi:mono/diheme cytochrome c family protein